MWKKKHFNNYKRKIAHSIWSVLKEKKLWIGLLTHTESNFSSWRMLKDRWKWSMWKAERTNIRVIYVEPRESKANCDMWPVNYISVIEKLP